MKMVRKERSLVGYTKKRVCEKFEKKRRRLRNKGVPSLEEDCWLWCLHCMRFFQVKDLRIDVVGDKWGCAFSDCNGAGFRVDIYLWNDWAKQNALAHWPKSVSELKKGLKCPLYPEDEQSSQGWLYKKNQASHHQDAWKHKTKEVRLKKAKTALTTSYNNNNNLLAKSQARIQDEVVLWWKNLIG